MRGTLYHYTCEHAHGEISKSGLLLPLRELVGPRRADQMPLSGLIWLTDLSVPMRDALGLTMQMVGCDRSAYRYRVTDDRGVVPWLYVRRDYPLAWSSWLEQTPGARPAHWYVAAGPVPVVFDPVQP